MFYVSGTILGAGDITMNKTHKRLWPRIACILVVGGGPQWGVKFKATLS